MAGGEFFDLGAQCGRQGRLLARDGRLCFDLGGVVQGETGDREQQHGHQAQGGADPVPLMQLAQECGAAHAWERSGRGGGRAGRVHTQMITIII
jgi:hypothetical protein